MYPHRWDDFACSRSEHGFEHHGRAFTHEMFDTEITHASSQPYWDRKTERMWDGSKVGCDYAHLWHHEGGYSDTYNSVNGDGTVVAVGIDPHYHSLDRGKPDSDGEFRIIGLPEVAAPYFNKAGEHWASSTWRIRNRLASTAQPEVKALVEAVERAAGIAGYTEREDLDFEAALSVVGETLRQALAAYHEAQP